LAQTLLMLFVLRQPDQNASPRWYKSTPLGFAPLKIQQHQYHLVSLTVPNSHPQLRRGGPSAKSPGKMQKTVIHLIRVPPLRDCYFGWQTWRGWLNRRRDKAQSPIILSRQIMSVYQVSEIGVDCYNLIIRE